MVVQKEIDLKALQSVVEDAMQTAIDNCEEVRINLIVAHDVIAIIKEAQKSETRNKLKSMKSCMPSCIGEYDENKTKCTCCKQKKECMEEKERNEWNVEENDDWKTTRKQMELHEKMTKMLEHLQRANGIIPVCFGNYECHKNTDKCIKCEYVKECETKSDTIPDCYGCYDDKDLDCNNCKNKESCVEETTKRINK